MARAGRSGGAIAFTAAFVLILGEISQVGFAADRTRKDDSPKSTTANGPRAQLIANLIDRQIDAQLVRDKVTPAGRADDGEFLRRVYLDLTGVIPPVEKVAGFLASTDPNKRSKVIDELVASPKFGEHLADQWENLLMLRDSTNKRLKSQPFYDWLAERFNKNQRWDEMVRDLLTVTGTQEENGAATFYIALRTPEKLTDQVTRLFMGVQLQCAQCHDHPFASWKRDDYWSTAAFFSKVRAGGKKVGIAKNGVESVNEDGLGKKAPDPDSALKLAPKFLGGDRPTIKRNEPYRPVLAAWLTTRANPFFAKAMVNRTWSQFFGRGLVNPVDNVSDSSDKSHPELFDQLAMEFAENGFDLKMLIRGICYSNAYQRASGSSAAGDHANYARMAVKPLTPEQLYDSLATVLGTLREGRERKGGKKAEVTFSRAKFIEFFDVPDGADTTEYTTGIPQVLQLMNSSPMNRNAKIVDELIDAKLPPEQGVERLYFATLSRRPSQAEMAKLRAFLKSEPQNLRAAYIDILWVLLNSSEFALNH